MAAVDVERDIQSDADSLGARDQGTPHALAEHACLKTLEERALAGDIEEARLVSTTITGHLDGEDAVTEDLTFVVVRTADGWFVLGVLDDLADAYHDVDVCGPM